MSKKRNREFWESARRNGVEYRKYFDRLTELAMSMFEWKNLPDTIDERFLELTLFAKGYCAFFEDEVLGYLALPCMIGGPLSVYRIPIYRKAYANNGYNRELDDKDSVLIFNNLLHRSSVSVIEDFAEQLYDVERSIIVNAKAQKTPTLLTCPESQKLTLKNAYMQMEGNMPVIHAYQDFDPKMISSISTGAPYVADKLYELKIKIWNEALTYLGITNLNVQKKERLISDEVSRSMGGVIASRYSRLNARKQAARQINEMFGLDVEVDFRDDFREVDDEFIIQEDGDKKTATPMVVDLRTNTHIGKQVPIGDENE